MMKKNPFTLRQMNVLRNVSDKQMDNMKGARLWRTFDFILSLLIVVVFALGIRNFIVEPIRVDGRSMVPTLQDNEHMIVEKISYMFHEPRRGDIVICFYPGYTVSCVKRVIGLPGETIAVHNGKIYIDGAELNESSYWGGYINGEMKEKTIKEKEYFVIGDNRNNSKDSRNSMVGAIPAYKIKGHVISVAWPFKNFRGFGKVSYS